LPKRAALAIEDESYQDSFLQRKATRPLRRTIVSQLLLHQLLGACTSTTELPPLR
jgi:hypothetical protein